MHEECGLFGIFARNEDVANLTYFGLYALQHRGQESAGIAVSDGTTLTVHKDMGLVAQVFTEESLAAMHGHIAIGHTRYSTTGGAKLSNAQPMRFSHATVGDFLLAHNGNLTNAETLHKQLSSAGVTFESTSDTEVLGRLLERTPGDSIESVLAAALPQMQGAYCLMLLTANAL